MMCKIERSEKMMWPIFMKSNKRNKSQQSFKFTYSIDMDCRGGSGFGEKFTHPHDLTEYLILYG
jgi:hypothetical protein